MFKHGRETTSNLAAVKEGYGSQEISDIAFIRSEYNPADALTKVTRSDLLENILDKNILEHPIEQWVIRTK